MKFLFIFSAIFCWLCWVKMYWEVRAVYKRMNHSASGNFLGPDFLYVLRCLFPFWCSWASLGFFWGFLGSGWDGQSLAGKLHEAPPVGDVRHFSGPAPPQGLSAGGRESPHLILRLGNYRSLIICRCAPSLLHSCASTGVRFTCAIWVQNFWLCSVYVFMGHSHTFSKT